MDKLETQDIPYGQALTSEQFVELFNNISNDYNAELGFDGAVTIADRGDWIYMAYVAILMSDSQYWRFENERAYSCQELTLMAQLATTSPEIREGNNNEKNN